MTQSVKDKTKAEPIKAIQTRRRQVPGLEDEPTWRAFLKATTDIDSLRAMTAKQHGLVLEELARRGAKKGAGRTKLTDDPQSRKLRALWINLHQVGAIKSGSEAALAAWCGRQLGHQVDDLRFVDAADKWRLIEALKGWCQRVGVEVK